MAVHPVVAPREQEGRKREAECSPGAAGAEGFGLWCEQSANVHLFMLRDISFFPQPGLDTVVRALRVLKA